MSLEHFMKPVFRVTSEYFGPSDSGPGSVDIHVWHVVATSAPQAVKLVKNVIRKSGGFESKYYSKKSEFYGVKEIDLTREGVLQ